MFVLICHKAEYGPGSVITMSSTDQKLFEMKNYFFFFGEKVKYIKYWEKQNI